MTQACNVLIPGGINGDCQIPLSEVKNVLICDKDVSFAYAAKKVLSNWTDLIKQDLTIYAVAGLDNYNNTTDDPNIVTGAISKAKKVTNNPLPSYEFFLDSNACDFKEMLKTVQGGIYGVFYELQDGTILGSIDQSGTEIGYFKPFKVNIKANTKLLQEVDATTAFRVYVNHLNFKQVFNQFFFEPSWDTAELAEAMPIGLSVVMTAISAGATQLINVITRCAGAYVGLVTADFDESLTMSNVAVPLVTMTTDSGGGDYILTPTKESSPVALVDGDYLAFRVKILNGSDVTHLSGWVNIQGVT